MRALMDIQFRVLATAVAAGLFAATAFSQQYVNTRKKLNASV
jgi:hypothetical protein